MGTEYSLAFFVVVRDPDRHFFPLLTPSICRRYRCRRCLGGVINRLHVKLYSSGSRDEVSCVV